MSPSPSLHLTSAAEQDLADAIDWYEEQHPGLGNEFLLSVDATFSNIRRNPEQYPVMYRGLRRALVRRFPFSVFYLVESPQITVLAVFHVRRNPKEWKSRF